MFKINFLDEHGNESWSGLIEPRRIDTAIISYKNLKWTIIDILWFGHDGKLERE